MEKNEPNPVDVHVGARVRMRRRAANISQEKLADQLGLTFQQVQKYERGANRISASKLYDIARALRTPLGYFFEGLADPAAGNPALELDEVEPDLNAFLATPEGGELARLFPTIPRGKVRRRVLDLVRALAEESAGAEPEAVRATG